VHLDDVLLVKESKWYGMKRVSSPDSSQRFPGKSLKTLIISRIGHVYD
jgi:hypothetical protein